MFPRTFISMEFSYLICSPGNIIQSLLSNIGPGEFNGSIFIEEIFVTN